MKKTIQIILILALTFSLSLKGAYALEKIKIGLLVPLTGKNYEIGLSIIKASGQGLDKECRALRSKCPCPP